MVAAARDRTHGRGLVGLGLGLCGDGVAVAGDDENDDAGRSCCDVVAG